MTAETPSQDLIRYDVLVQEALRGVVRKVLQEIVKTGLPGQHHFYISFDTHHPGVRLSTRMRQRYPDEMTIVLQHQFWDLVVTDHAVEVGLSFGGIPERLLVPFTAIKGFFDPSVQFGLQFETGSSDEDEDEAGEDAPAAAAPASPAAKTPRLEPVSLSVPADAKPGPVPAKAAKKPEPVKATEKPAEATKPAEAAKPKAEPAPEKPAGEKADADKAAEPGATVISMDAFRKKS